MPSRHRNRKSLHRKRSMNRNQSRILNQFKKKIHQRYRKHLNQRKKETIYLIQKIFI